MEGRCGSVNALSQNLSERIRKKKEYITASVRIIGPERDI
jgi:hypothetical protein